MAPLLARFLQSVVFVPLRDGDMERANYRGTVRDSGAEQARDQRMLDLAEQGLETAVIAQRMGLTAYAVRQRIKRARALREQSSAPSDKACG